MNSERAHNQNAADEREQRIFKSVPSYLHRLMAISVVNRLLILLNGALSRSPYIFLPLLLHPHACAILYKEPRETWDDKAEYIGRWQSALFTIVIHFNVLD